MNANTGEEKHERQHTVDHDHDHIYIYIYIYIQKAPEGKTALYELSWRVNQNRQYQKQKCVMDHIHVANKFVTLWPSGPLYGQPRLRQGGCVVFTPFWPLFLPLARYHLREWPPCFFAILSYDKNISRTSAVSSTNFRSILIFASCVVGTCNILYG